MTLWHRVQRYRLHFLLLTVILFAHAHVSCESSRNRISHFPIASLILFLRIQLNPAQTVGLKCFYRCVTLLVSHTVHPTFSTEFARITFPWPSYDLIDHAFETVVKGIFFAVVAYFLSAAIFVVVRKMPFGFSECYRKQRHS